MIQQEPGQAGAVAAGAFDPDCVRVPVAPQPAKQLSVAAAASGELPVTKQPSLLVDGGGVVSAAMGINAADDNASALGHAGTAFPLGHEPGQVRTGRAGGHTSDGAWSHKLVSGHTSPSGRVHSTRPYRAGRQLPG
jgi:hypothetical protein